MHIRYLEFKIKPAIKYLGEMDDSKVSVGVQIRGTADRAARAVSTLDRLMGKIDGHILAGGKRSRICPVRLFTLVGMFKVHNVETPIIFLNIPNL